MNTPAPLYSRPKGPDARAFVFAAIANLESYLSGERSLSYIKEARNLLEVAEEKDGEERQRAPL